MAFADDTEVMRYALAIARQGFGCVEPNPAVGAVIVDDQRRLIASGWHKQFGETHAEVNAITDAEGQTSGHDLFVTLEPCSHQGKTPPCADAVIAAGFRRVIIGCQDPAPHVAGRGIRKLREAGIDVLMGVCEQAATNLIAPFRKLMVEQLPWVHAKWAMTLDGRIATRTGHSRWITGEQSRAEVHRMRGCMDAIITGAGTVRNDNPELTARPPGPRIPLRVVLDRDGSSIGKDSRLIQTIAEAPLLVCVNADHIQSAHVLALQNSGAEILPLQSEDHGESAHEVLQELGRRQLTNVWLEAGAGLMGSFFDRNLVDEVHVFIASKIVGGIDAIPPIGGCGRDEVPSISSLKNVSMQPVGEDFLLEGRVSKA